MVLEWNTKHGWVCPDSEALTFIQFYCDKSNFSHIKIATSSLFTAARLLHAQKRIKIDYVLFDGERIEIDEYGKLSSWPAGLCDDEMKMLAEMSKIRRKKS